MTREFTIQMEVRDHECDVQGIVNNSVYLNYLEHARHKMLRGLGVDFTGLAKKGIYLVVIQNLIHYRHPLQSGDDFTVTTVIGRESRLKIRFQQTIRRSRDQRLILEARVTGAAIDRDYRPLRLENIEEMKFMDNES